MALLTLVVLLWGASAGAQSSETPALAIPTPRNLETAGALGLWALDDGRGMFAVDSSGHGLDGYLEGGVQWTLGQQGLGITLDGIDDLVRVADLGSSSPIDLSDALTLAVWVRPDALDGSTQMLVSKDESYELEIGKLGADSWGLRLNNVVAATAATPLEEGIWQHLAVTWDGTTVRLFYNGLLDGSSSFEESLVSNDNDLGLGGRPSSSILGGPTFHLFGALDQVEIYDRALAPEEVADRLLETLTDIVPPLRQDLEPSTSLDAGTSSATLSLTTDELADCRYGTEGGIPFDGMEHAFVGDGTFHEALATVSEGIGTFAVRCRDPLGNTNNEDVFILVGVGPSELTSGVLALWQFDEEDPCLALDSLGELHGLPGPECPTNAPLRSPGHDGGGALSFDGSDDHVRVPNDPALSNPQGLTLSGWIRSAGKPGFRALFDARDQPTDGYNLYLTDQSKAFIRINDSTLTGSQSLEDGQWHHVVGTWDGEELSLYVDGLLDRRSAVGVDSLDVAADLLLGHHFAVEDYSFQGELSRASLWDRALSEVEVLDLYQGSQTEMLDGEDAFPPQIEVLSPLEGQRTRQTSLLVTGTVTDNVSVASVAVNGVEATLDDRTFQATVPFLGSGPRQVEVVATDSSDNETSLVVSFLLDTLPPDLMVEEPIEGTVTIEDFITADLGAEDDQGIAGIEVNGLPLELTQDRFEGTLALAPGVNTLTFSARDPAGNTTEETRQVTRVLLPELLVTSPANQTLVSESTVEVLGTISDPSATVEVAGNPATVSNGTFSALVDLREGTNLITTTAVNEHGLSTTATLSVVLDTEPPVLVVGSPAEGAVTHQPLATVSGAVYDTATGFEGRTPLEVTVHGVRAQVENNSFSAEGILLVEGENVLSVAAVDSSGNTRTVQRTVHLDTNPGARLVTISGNHQTARIGHPLPQPLVVQLTDSSGAPAPGRGVHFSVIEGDGSLDSGRRQVMITTDAAGRASVDFDLGTRAGRGNHRVLAHSPELGVSVEIVASATAGDPSHVLVDLGDQQTGIPGQALPKPFSVVVTDSEFNRLPGVEVWFRVVRGGGSLAAGSTEELITTDARGMASAVLTLGPTEGVANNAVWATLATPGSDSLATFAASGLIPGDPAATTIEGVVLDNADRPVPGVTLTVEGSDPSTQTDNEGLFRIEGAPAGTVHLHVEGSTALVPGEWPSLDFELVTIPGRRNDLGRPIYLLPLERDRGLVVSADSGGTLTLPELPGFSLEIEPGSVTFPGGGKDGVVSVTLVNSERIPMAPNFAQQPRFVVTIQPSGAVFDPPAKIALPNTDGLVPGQVTELYSFDHDLGRFVSIGPGSVSEDGLSVHSMPGFGIVKAGWHCGGNPTESGTPHGCKDCKTCVGNVCVEDLAQNGTPCGDDGDPCTVDLCLFGNCTHWNKRIDVLDAKANGEDSTEIFMGETVQFTQVNRTDHCDIDRFTWDLGEGDTATGSSTQHTYKEPGSYQYRLDAECDGGCAENNDSGSVKVKCRNVEITGMSPDIRILCPGCDKSFEVEVDPECKSNPDDPDLSEDCSVEWRVIPESAGSFTGNTFKAADRENAVTGHALLEVAVGGHFDQPGCIDQEGVFIYNQGSTSPIKDHLCLLKNGFLILGTPLLESMLFPNCTDDSAGTSAANAWTHAMVSCVLTIECGRLKATRLGLAQENDQKPEDNPCWSAKMDLHNNAVGRAIGGRLALRGMHSAHCAAHVSQAQKKGLLRWYNEDPTTDAACSDLLQKDFPPDHQCTPVFW